MPFDDAGWHCIHDTACRLGREHKVTLCGIGEEGGGMANRVTCLSGELCAAFLHDTLV